MLRGFFPAALPAGDVRAQLKDEGLVRQKRAGPLQFPASAITIEISEVEMCGHGKMGLTGLGSQLQRTPHNLGGELQALRGMIEPEKIEAIVSAYQFTMSGEKFRIACDRFVQEARGFEEGCSALGVEASTSHQGPGSHVPVISLKIVRGSLLDDRFLSGRKLDLQLRDHLLGQLALNGEHVRYLAIVPVRPNVGVGARID